MWVLTGMGGGRFRREQISEGLHMRLHHGGGVELSQIRPAGARPFRPGDGLFELLDGERRREQPRPVGAHPRLKLGHGAPIRYHFRADAALAMPGVYEFLEAERIKYAIPLPANKVLQERICEQWIKIL